MSAASSPFPGTDLYLEVPGLWPGFHDSLLTYLRDDFQTPLPERNYVDPGASPEDASWAQDRVAAAGRSSGRA